MSLVWLVLGGIVACGDDASSSGSALTKFSFTAADNPGLGNDVVARIDGTAVTAIVPFGTSVKGLVARFEVSGGTVTVGNQEQRSGETANDFTGPIAYKITAGDGAPQVYVVQVTPASRSDKEITAFGFQDVDNTALAADVPADIDGTEITATVPFGTDVTKLVATFETNGVSVAIGGAAQVSGASKNDFTEPVTYTVTAANGSTKDFEVTVTIAPSDAKALTSYKFLKAANANLLADVEATITGTDIAATVPFGTDVTKLVATFDVAGKSVAVGDKAQVSGTTANDFTGPVTYTVTADDDSKANFKVTVTVAKDDAKDITKFEFLTTNNPGLAENVAATITGTAIAATVPFGTDVKALVATFQSTGASVKVGELEQASGTTPNDFKSPVIYQVIAADDSTQNFTVTVEIKKNPAKEITKFEFLKASNGDRFEDVLATITGADITATVPFGTDVKALVATFETTGVSVKVGEALQVSGTTANDFTNLVTYTVTAADGSTEEFKVTVKIEKNPAKEITLFKFLKADNEGLAADVTATITGADITATVPLGTNVEALVATFETTGDSVKVGGTQQDSGTTANDFTNPVAYQVIAADDSTKNFTVTVTFEAAPE